jgi:hypothetical protein
MSKKEQSLSSEEEAALALKYIGESFPFANHAGKF